MDANLAKIEKADLLTESWENVGNFILVEVLGMGVPQISVCGQVEDEPIARRESASYSRNYW